MLLFVGWPGPPVCSSEPPGGHTFQSSRVCLPTWSGCSACWSAWRKLLQGPGKGREHIQDVMYQKHIISVSVSNLNIISSYQLPKQMLESDPVRTTAIMSESRLRDDSVNAYASVCMDSVSVRKNCKCQQQRSSQTFSEVWSSPLTCVSIPDLFFHQQ